jgi:hypothetical protein
MKIKKIVDMCRRDGVVRIYEDDHGVQWLSNGYSCYPLYDVPELSEDEFFTVFDFSAKQRDETVFQRAALPDSLSFKDFDATERECEKLSPSIPYGSRLLIPYKTVRGIKFLDSEYLDPLIGESGESQVFERISKKGEAYFAIKAGMCLRAVVMPFNAVNRSFVDNIEKIYSLCRDALETKGASEQLSAFDPEDN